MTRMQIVFFCAATLLGSLVISAALFPFVSLSNADVNLAQTPKPMEDYGPVDLGEDYGELSVFELVGYYIENPPKPETAAAPRKKKHFGGC